MVAIKLEALPAADHPVGAKRPRPRAVHGSGALAAWGGAVVLALIGQAQAGSSQRAPYSLALYVLAMILALVSSRLADRDAPLPEDAQDCKPGWCWALQPRSLRTVLSCGLLACGLAAMVAAVVDVALAPRWDLSTALWLASLATASAGTWLAAGARARLHLDRATCLELGCVLVLVGLAFALRIINLAGIPADVHGDEAAVGLEARRILAGQTANLFGLGWASLPELSFVPSAVGLFLFGDDLWGLRLVSVIQGSLAVALLYVLTKRLFSRRVAVVASFVLATSQMAIHYSRTGNNYIGGLFAGLLLTALLLRALAHGRPVDFLWCGFAAGLALSVYYTARFALVVAALYCLQRALTERGFFRTRWRGLAVAIVGAGLFLAPQLVTYAHDPASVFDRTSAVFLLKPENIAHQMDADHVRTTGAMLWQQVIRSVGAFNVFGETSLQYGERAPLLDFWSGALFVLGAAVVSVKARQARYLVFASWFWVTLVFGSVLTTDALFSPHIVGMLGALAVLPSLMVELGWRAVSFRFGRIGNRVASVGAISLAALVGWSNYSGYFRSHLSSMEPEGIYTVLSRYAQEINGEDRMYLLGDADTAFGYDTMRFLVPNVDGVEIRDSALILPLVDIPARKGVVFVDTARDARFRQIQAEYPGRSEEVHPNNVGYPEFYSYRVSHEQLAAAAPGVSG